MFCRTCREIVCSGVENSKAMLLGLDVLFELSHFHDAHEYVSKEPCNSIYVQSNLHLHIDSPETRLCVFEQNNS